MLPALRITKAVFNLGLLEYRRKNLPQAIGYFRSGAPNRILMTKNQGRTSWRQIAITRFEGPWRSLSVMKRRPRTVWHYAMRGRLRRSPAIIRRCGNCLKCANFRVNKRIAYLPVRAPRMHIWASVLIIGFLGFGTWKTASNKRPRDSS